MLLTCKGFLDIDHIPCARLHEPATVLARILQSISSGHDARILQIALIAGDDLDRGWHADVNALGARAQLGQEPVIVLFALVGLEVDHVDEVVQRREAVGVGDVVDEQEGVRFEVRRRP